MWLASIVAAVGAAVVVIGSMWSDGTPRSHLIAVLLILAGSSALLLACAHLLHHTP